jgi:hypothetical protein
MGRAVDGMAKITSHAICRTNRSASTKAEKSITIDLSINNAIFNVNKKADLKHGRILAAWTANVPRV